MSVTLTASDIITLVSTAATVVSFTWGLRQQRAAQSAREEARRFRQLLLKQQISQEFGQVPAYALTLFRHVRAGRWDEAAEASLLLSAKLASLDGVQDEMISPKEKAQLTVALEVMGSLNQRLSSNTVVRTEESGELVEACNLVLLSTHALEATLRMNASLGGDDNG